MKDDVDASTESRNKEMELLINTKEKNRLPLMVKPNVIGLGIGLRTRAGIPTDEVVIKVYVSKKIPKELLAKEDLVPPSVEFKNKKVAVDVEEAEIPEAQVFTLRSRPLIGGSSIGPTNTVAGGNWVGTLGACITLDDGQTYILSNNHVMALVNQLRIGTKIVQPSIPDGGVPPTWLPPQYIANDHVATLSQVVPIDFGTHTITFLGTTFTLPNPNDVDCALAKVRDAFDGANREIHWVGYPAMRTFDVGSIFWPFNIRVCKMGRTSEFTVGRIADVSWDGFIDYSPVFGNPAHTNRAWFENQLRVDGGTVPFSLPGDSGSLVLETEQLRPVGLLFAGSPNSGFCNPINTVMSSLGIPRI